jgi:hypothetical protein
MSVEFFNSHAVESHKMWPTASNVSYSRFYFVTLKSISRTSTAEANKVLRRSVSRRQLANRPFNVVVTRCTEKRNTPAVVGACSHEQVISGGVGRFCNINRALLRSVPQSKMFTMRLACKEHEIRTELWWKASGTAV